MTALPLSIVVPCYNEEGCLRELHVRLTRAAASVGGEYVRSTRWRDPAARSAMPLAVDARSWT